MQNDEIKDSLINAFQKYWMNNRQIRINGKEHTTKGKAFNIYITDEESVIDMLLHVIYLGNDKKTITGKVDCHIIAPDPKDFKEVKLKFSISTLEYSCKKTIDDKPEIQISNVMFTPRLS